MTVGPWSVDSFADPQTELISIQTRQAVGLPIDTCKLLVYGAPTDGGPAAVGAELGAALQAGPAGGTAGPFSVDLSGQALAAEDAISIELRSGNSTETVFTGELQAVRSGLGQTHLLGRTGFHRLVATRIAQVYENQTLGQIVSDLAQQASVQVGNVNTGSTYPYFVVDGSASVYSYIKHLAGLEGLDVYFDTANQLTVARFDKSSSDHTVRYGVDILGLSISRHQASIERVVVTGESPSSNQGSNTWHWIAKDIFPFRAEAGNGSTSVLVQDGALRTKDSTDSAAGAKLRAIQEQAVAGTMVTLGNPLIRVCDAIEVVGVPSPEANGLFKVCSVRHRLNKRSGYQTQVGLVGQVGAGGAADLAGSAGLQMAGALGR